MTKLWGHPLVLFLITIIIFLVVLTLRQNLANTHDLTNQKQELTQEIESLKNELDNKQGHLKQAEHPFTREKILRNELLLKKDQEIILQLPDMPVTESIPEVSPTPSAWQEWQQVLF